MVASLFQVYEESIPDPYVEAMKRGKKLSKKEEEMLSAKAEDRRNDIANKRKKLQKKYHPGNDVLEKEYIEQVLSKQPQQDEDDVPPQAFFVLTEICYFCDVTF